MCFNSSNFPAPCVWRTPFKANNDSVRSLKNKSCNMLRKWKDYTQIFVSLWSKIFGNGDVQLLQFLKHFLLPHTSKWSCPNRVVKQEVRSPMGFEVYIKDTHLCTALSRQKSSFCQGNFFFLSSLFRWDMYSKRQQCIVAALGGGDRDMEFTAHDLRNTSPYKKQATRYVNILSYVSEVCKPNE